ncbi:MAG: 30S ribosomal protein S16 [Fimbriiglobus sp.]
MSKRAEDQAVSVVIRMKQMGRTHRHYFRIVAIDKRQPRDGRAIEELGMYDPHSNNEEGRLHLIPSRIKYWQSVGAKPSDTVQVLIDKYLAKFEEVEARETAEKAAAKAAAAEAAAKS